MLNSMRHAHGAGHCVLQLPVLDPQLSDRPHEWRESKGVREVRLDESELFSIIHDPLSLIIGGPPGAGKSTLAVSLMQQVNCVLSSLESRGGCWTGLTYRATCFPLDVATPVAEAILHGEGQSGHKMRAQKMPWTLGLAKKTRDQLDEMLLNPEEPQLILSDLPGRITEITSTLTRGSDVGIIITNNWEEVRTWRQFFDSRNIAVVGEFFNCDKPSLISQLHRGQRVRGRLYKPSRTEMGWDGTVRMLAELFLFDLLPAYRQKRYTKN